MSQIWKVAPSEAPAAVKPERHWGDRFVAPFFVLALGWIVILGAADIYRIFGKPDQLSLAWYLQQLLVPGAIVLAAFSIFLAQPRSVFYGVALPLLSYYFAASFLVYWNDYQANYGVGDLRLASIYALCYLATAAYYYAEVASPRH